MVELLGYVLAKRKASSAGADAPTGPIVRVGPKQVAHGPLVGYLLDSIELPHMIKGVNGGAEATVEAEYVIVDQGREGEVVEEVGEELPHVGTAVFANALVVEAVHLRDLSGFVVAAEDEHSVGISHLETYEHRHGLDGVVASIHCGIVVGKQHHQGTQRWQKLVTLSMKESGPKRPNTIMLKTILLPAWALSPPWEIKTQLVEAAM